MPVETDVMRAIIKAAISAIGNALPIKAPGIVFQPPNDQKYVELVLIQNPNASQTWGDEILFSGILRIILHWPIDGKGIYSPVEYLSLIREHFPKGRHVSYGQATLLISDHPYYTDVIEGGPDNLYGLTVPYQFFYVP